MQPANMQPANMQPANMQPANMQPANMQPANMQPASMQPACGPTALLFHLANPLLFHLASLLLPASFRLFSAPDLRPSSSVSSVKSVVFCWPSVWFPRNSHSPEKREKAAVRGMVVKGMRTGVFRMIPLTIIPLTSLLPCSSSERIFLPQTNTSNTATRTYVAISLRSLRSLVANSSFLVASGRAGLFASLCGQISLATGFGNLCQSV